jgi:hypothetical protein
MVVWSFTEAEIYHRWDIHQRFDLLNRYARAQSSASTSVDGPVIDNSEAQLLKLEALLPEQGDDQGDLNGRTE